MKSGVEMPGRSSVQDEREIPVAGRPRATARLQQIALGVDPFPPAPVIAPQIAVHHTPRAEFNRD